nr:uncharacterized protein CI109_002032 [Kwoniella shandongensis]KAA5529607.1 hypothetical protein CI109_002032 [Kwoniella shandongensis]
MGNSHSRKIKDRSSMKEKDGFGSCSRSSQAPSEKTNLTRASSITSDTSISTVASTFVQNEPTPIGGCQKAKGDGDYTLVVDACEFQVKEQIISTASSTMKDLFDKYRAPHRRFGINYNAIGSSRAFALALDLIYGRDLIQPDLCAYLELYFPVINFLKVYGFDQAIDRLGYFLQQWLATNSIEIDKSVIFCLGTEMENVQLCAAAIRAAYLEIRPTKADMKKAGLSLDDYGPDTKFVLGSSRFDINGMAKWERAAIPTKYRNALKESCKLLTKTNGSKAEWDAVAKEFSRRLGK